MSIPRLEKKPFSLPTKGKVVVPWASQGSVNFTVRVAAIAGSGSVALAAPAAASFKTRRRDIVADLIATRLIIHATICA